MTNEIACTSCGYVGEPKTITRGTFAVEVVLWLCFLVPGFIYSVWRMSSRHDGCPTCGLTTLIPQDSPMGKKVIREHALVVPVSTIEPARPPSKVAKSIGRSLGRFVGRLLK